MLYALDRLNPNDTFQVLSFSNRPEKLFGEPMLATSENINTAKKYIAELDALGGTEMMDAIKEATRAEAPDHRLRLFILMSDGYVGDDENIIALVKKTRGVSRWFTFGTGDSVNRFLIDGIARAGGGEADYVLLNSNTSDVAQKFYDKIATPVLSDIQITFHGVDVAEVQPQTVNDLWGHKPIYLTGKYLKSGTGSMTIKGYAGGKPYSETLPLTFPAKDGCNSVLPSVWARAKVAEIMPFLYEAQQFRYRSSSPEVVEARKSVEQLGLRYHILTDYTSFVAVDDSPRRYETATKSIRVPVETPNGVSLKKITGQVPSVRPEANHISSSGEIGRVEGPRDMNMFQVEPTVVDERHYTAGRSERHQKSSPTLPEGAPIPDMGSPAGSSSSRTSPLALGTSIGYIASNSDRRQNTTRGAWSGVATGGAVGTSSTLVRKADTENGADRNLMIKPNENLGTLGPTPGTYMYQNLGYSAAASKIDQQVLKRFERLKPKEALKVVLQVSTITDELLKWLRSTKSIKLISVDKESNRITITITKATGILVWSMLKEVTKITLAN